MIPKPVIYTQTEREQRRREKKNGERGDSCKAYSLMGVIVRVFYRRKLEPMGRDSEKAKCIHIFKTRIPTHHCIVLAMLPIVSKMHYGGHTEIAGRKTRQDLCRYSVIKLETNKHIIYVYILKLPSRQM